MADDPHSGATTRFDAWVARGNEGFPGLVGLEAVEFRPNLAVLALDVSPRHLAPNGYLHGGAVTTLADSACGYGCHLSLPEGATGFTTIELKANFIASTTEGRLTCEARLVHDGRTTQVWDAVTRTPADRTLALFRATQLILYP